MCAQEVGCFARALRCARRQIRAMNLLYETPTSADLDGADVVLLGGSGDYSVAKGGPWIQPTFDAMRLLHSHAMPTFASCFGFQLMAQALGGEVVTDASRAELGTLDVKLTAAGAADPIFGPLHSPFKAQMGHQDVVVRLPPGATCLASTDRVENQAFRFDGLPIYCTQFHPELDRQGMLERLETYPEYVEKIAGVTFDSFVRTLVDTPGTEALLHRFLELMVPSPG